MRHAHFCPITFDQVYKYIKPEKTDKIHIFQIRLTCENKVITFFSLEYFIFAIVLKKFTV